jgi:hypothetical protein
MNIGDRSKTALTCVARNFENDIFGEQASSDARFPSFAQTREKLACNADFFVPGS